MRPPRLILLTALVMAFLPSAGGGVASAAGCSTDLGRISLACMASANVGPGQVDAGASLLICDDSDGSCYGIRHVALGATGVAGPAVEVLPGPAGLPGGMRIFRGDDATLFVHGQAFSFDVAPSVCIQLFDAACHDDPVVITPPLQR